MCHDQKGTGKQNQWSKLNLKEIAHSGQGSIQNHGKEHQFNGCLHKVDPET